MCFRQGLKQSFKIFVFIIIFVFSTFIFFVKLLKYFFAINSFNTIIITIKILTQSFKIYINIIKLLKTRTRNVSMIHVIFVWNLTLNSSIIIKFLNMKIITNIIFNIIAMKILIDCVNFVAIIAKILFVMSMKKKKSNDCQININHENFIIMNYC